MSTGLYDLGMALLVATVEIIVIATVGLLAGAFLVLFLDVFVL